MMNFDFAGRETLIAKLDAAVQFDTVEDVTTEVRNALTEIIQSGELRLPTEFCRPVDGTYARRLVYKSDEHDYVVIAMCWGPGQSTPLHDHSGVWCVEGVIQGEIDVTQYDLKAKTGDGRWMFQPLGTIRAVTGSSGSLIPPFEYHTITNGCTTKTSVTLHVYGKELFKCVIFDQQSDGWYAEHERTLGYHN